MNDECQYCLGMDSAIEKLKTEIDELNLDINQIKNERDSWLNEWKDRDQEIERLKDDLYKRTNAELNEQKMRIYQTNLSAELSTKLKEREELIKEAIKVVERAEFALHPEFNGGSEGGAIKDCSYWLEKARKMVGET